MKRARFEYGGYHFIPERKFAGKENDFSYISKRLQIDTLLGFCKERYAYESKYPYSHKGFYKASGNSDCDIFRCIENGNLYVPCENDLQMYIVK